MTSDHDHLEILAKQLADGIEHSADMDKEENARIIAAISANFRAARGIAHIQTDTDKLLFKWGHLDVLEKLGEGGFGEIYCAYDSLLDREVALKLRSSNHSSPADSRAFIQEARRLARVRHPNVIAVHGADIHDGRVGLWMDLLDGTDLEQKLKDNGNIDSCKAYALATDMASALAAVHSAGLAHGDVKASNVMIHNQGQFVLMDFGAGSEVLESNSSPRAGTPLIMAPELFCDAPLSPATDQYSLGVLLFRQLSGDYPLVAKSSSDLYIAHQQGLSRSLRELCPHLPHGLIGLVDELLSPDATKRPTATMLGERIRWLLAAPQRRKRLSVVAAFIILMAAGTIFSTLGYLDARREEQRAVLAHNESAALNGFLSNILSSARPSQSGKNTPVIEVLASAAKQLQNTLADQPLARARALFVVGKSYLTLGSSDRALVLLEQAYRLQLEQLGEDHPNSLETRAELGMVLARLNRLDEAKSMLVDATDILESIAVNQALRMRYYSALSVFYDYSDDEKRAEQFARAAFALTDKDKDPLQYFQKRRKVINQLSIQKRFSEAEPMARESLIWAENHHPQSDLVLGLRSILSSIMGQTGRLTEAEALARINLKLATEWLGSQDPYVVNILHLLGAILNAQGRTEEALVSNQDALAISVLVNGENHETTLDIMGNLANQLRKLGQFEAAKSYYLDLINKADSNFPPNHSVGHYPRLNLTKLYLKTGDYKAGLNLAKHSLPMLTASRGAEHYLTLALRSELAQLYWLTEDYTQAKIEFNTLLQLGSRKPESNHKLIAQTLEFLGDIEAHNGEIITARTFYEKAYDLRLESEGTDHLAAVVVRDKLRALKPK